MFVMYRNNIKLVKTKENGILVNGNDVLVQLDRTDTSNIISGWWKFELLIVDGDDVKGEVARGAIKLIPAKAASWPEIML